MGWGWPEDCQLEVSGSDLGGCERLLEEQPGGEPTAEFRVAADHSALQGPWEVEEFLLAGSFNTHLHGTLSNSLGVHFFSNLKRRLCSEWLLRSLTRSMLCACNMLLCISKCPPLSQVVAQNYCWMFFPCSPRKAYFWEGWDGRRGRWTFHVIWICSSSVSSRLS